MANSASITNRNAVPRVLSNARLTGDNLVEMKGVTPIANAEPISVAQRVGEIPSNAVISQVAFACSAITGATASLGLYRTTADGGAVVSVGFFIAGQSIATATAAEVTRSGTITVANQEQPLWQLLGLTADPQITYDVAWTLTVTSSAAGNIFTRVAYTQ